jgi:hypothetical protein
MYVLVRTDQSYGQIVVQAAHAVAEATRRFLPDEVEHPHLVVCAAKSIDEILAEKAYMDEVGVKSTMFYEEDIGNLPTAVASEPIFGERRKLFKHWRLLR